MKKPKEQIVYRKLEDIKLLEQNPRYIKEEDFNRLCASVQNNPDYFEGRPILLSDRTGELVIIAGNQRYRAAKEVGLKEVPTFLFHGLTESKEKEIVIRDNVQNGRWDWDILGSEMWGSVEELSDWGVDVSFLGGNEETDIDELFEETPVEEKEKHIKLTVTIPENLNEQLSEITEAVKEAVAAYDGVMVK